MTLTLLDHLERAHEGERVVQRLMNLTLSGHGAQFTHRFVRSSRPDMVEHEREGCDVCDALDATWAVLEDYRRLVRGWLASAETAAQEEALRQAEQEYGERIVAETRGMLLEHPEFVTG